MGQKNFLSLYKRSIGYYKMLSHKIEDINKMVNFIFNRLKLRFEIYEEMGEIFYDNTKLAH